MTKANKQKEVLSNSDKFFISNNLDMSLEELVAAINKDSVLVQEYLTELNNQPVVPAKKKGSDISNMFAKKGGAVIMTEGAAQMGDKVKTGKIDTSHIHKIK